MEERVICAMKEWWNPLSWPRIWQGIGIVIIGFLLAFGMWGVFQSLNANRLQTVENLERQLYQDSRHLLVNEEADVREYERYQKLANQLTGKQKSNHQALANSALAKYQLLKLVNQDLYQESIDQAKLLEESPTEMPLLMTDLEFETIKDRVSDIPIEGLMDDALSIGLKDYLQYALDYPAAYQKLQAFEFQDPSDLNYEALIQMVYEVEALELAIAPYKHQPLLADKLADLDQWAKVASDTLLAAYYDIGFDPPVLSSISNIETLEPYIIDTPLFTKKVIALTFDDGPNEEYTPQLLDILADHQIKATFFVYGAYVDDHPEIAQRIVDEGHILGNHSYTHPDFSKLSNEEVLEEINWTQESIYDQTGYENTLYRMPFGAGGQRVVDLLQPMTSVLWNVDSLDWEFQDRDLIVEHVMNQLLPRTLLLMHDTNQASVDAVAELIPKLKEMNYEFVDPLEVGFEQYHFGE
ncbi:polysaccharide deacetylase family protein [Hutsoniella sourekii]